MHIILKKKNNTEGYYIFFNKQKGICIADITRGRVSDYQSIFSDATPDFDAIIDKNDTVHILYHDLQSNLYHVISSQNGWDKTIILKPKKSKISASCISDLRLIYAGSMLSAFYTLDYKGQQLISHQILMPVDTQPEAVDVIDKNSDYYISADSSGNIYLYYTPENKEKGFGFKQYIYNKKAWSADMSELSHNGSGIQNPHAVYAFRYGHLTYVKDGQIVYFKKDKSELRVGQAHDNSLRPVIIVKQDRIFVMWQAGTRVLGVMSDNNGHSFTRLNEILLSRTNNIILFKLSSANTDNSIIADLCYGTLINRRITMASLNNYFSNLVLDLHRSFSDDGTSSENEAKPIGHEIEEYAARETNSPPPNYSVPKDIEEQKNKIKEILNIQSIPTFSQKFDEFVPTPVSPPAPSPAPSVSSIKSVPKNQISNQEIMRKLEQLDKKISRLLKKL